MSAQDHAPHAHGADEHDADAAHDDDHAHAEPPPPEPDSPAWLPLLGGGLFLLGLLGYLVMSSPEPGEDDATNAAATAEAPAAKAPAARPAGSAVDAARRLLPTLRPALRDSAQPRGGAAAPRPAAGH